MVWKLARPVMVVMLADVRGPTQKSRRDRRDQSNGEVAGGPVAEDEALHNGAGSTWHLLVDFAPDAGASSEHLSVERVTKALGGLGLQPAEVDRMGKALLEALRKATKQEGQDRHTSPVSIRVWVSGLSTAKARSNSRARKVSSQKHRGWGFFLLERHEDDRQAPQPESNRVIELYLYQEREHSETPTLRDGPPAA